MKKDIQNVNKRGHLMGISEGLKSINWYLYFLKI